MEVFSLLKYWRGGGGGGGAAAALRGSTLAAAVLRPSSPETDDDEDGYGIKAGSDEGPFFDLEFPTPDEEEIESDSSGAPSVDGEGEDDTGLRSDRSVSVSPSDHLFLKGSSANPKHHLPALLAKSATKLRVFTFRFRKPKSAPAQPAPSSASPKTPQNGKYFAKFRAEEVPIVSLFTRERSCGSAKLHAEEATTVAATAAAAEGSEERKVARDVVQRYLNKIKPFYVRASKRYSGQLNPGDEARGPRVMIRSLKKSRSASAAVAAVRSPPPPMPKRRDDSLLLQEDGIQSAIAHCKRSFNADKAPEAALARSRSDPGGESRA